MNPTDHAPDDQPAEIDVVWKSFNSGDNGYIASYSVALTKAVNGVTLALGAPSMPGRALDAKVAFAKIDVNCHRVVTANSELDETETINITSDGKAGSSTGAQLRP
jgi:hypothetical protein